MVVLPILDQTKVTTKWSTGLGDRNQVFWDLITASEELATCAESRQTENLGGINLVAARAFSRIRSTSVIRLDLIF